MIERLPSRPFLFFFELPDEEEDLSLLFQRINMFFDLVKVFILVFAQHTRDSFLQLIQTNLL